MFLFQAIDFESTGSRAFLYLIQSIQQARQRKMTDEEINYKNNPLHGLSLKNMITELVEYYSFEILFAYMNINCFKTNPSIDSSVKFLKKTDWAREKVEGFYLYQYKNLPRVSSEQFKIPPRDRIVPEHHKVGEPAVLSLEDAERLREKRAKKAEGFGKARRGGTGKTSGFGGSRGGSSRAKTPYSESGFQEKPHKKKSPRADDDFSESSSESSADVWGKWKK